MEDCYFHEFSKTQATLYCRSNHFAHRFITSVIEGINNFIKTVRRTGYGFRDFANFKQRVLIIFA